MRLGCCSKWSRQGPALSEGFEEGDRQSGSEATEARATREARSPHGFREATEKAACATRTEPKAEVFLSVSDTANGVPELGKEFATNRRSSWNRSNRLSYFTLCEWRGTADFSGRSLS